MKRQVIFPKFSSAGYVHHLVVLEYANREGELLLPLVTNGHPSIVFLSAPGAIDGRLLGPLTVFGHNRQPFFLGLRESFTLIACFLQPYCLPALLGVGAGELTDRQIGLDLLRPEPARTYGQRLLDAVSTEQRVGLLEELVVQLSAVRPVMPLELVRHATEAIRGGTGLAVLQKELGLSERGLQRLFESNVGLTPRLYGRICKFNAAFRQLDAHGYRRLSDVAYEQGYADQSHFIRAFKEFTGFTPREYVGRAAPYKG